MLDVFQFILYLCTFFSDKFSGTLKSDDTSLNLPSHPAQAWLCNEKENLFSSEHTQFNSR